MDKFLKQSKNFLLLSVLQLLLAAGLGSCEQAWGDWIRPQWSPDGKNISMIKQASHSAWVDTQYSYALYIIDADGKNKRKLVQNIDIDYAWSPDGNKILFTRSYNGESQPLVVINIITKEDLVLADSAQIKCFSWSPDAKQIAFIGRNNHLFTIDVDGSNEKEIVSDVDCKQVSWSPDGEKICFVTYKDDICVIDSDGMNRKKISTGYFLEWSPNGQRIALCHKERHQEENELCIVDARSGESRKIADNNPSNFVSWSPDGTKIAFFNVEGGNPDKGELLIMDVDEGNRIKLIGGFPREFSWSPDSRTIVYDRKEISIGKRLGGYQLGVYLINTDTKDEVKLTKSGSIGGALSLSFSPDGKKVLFQAFGRTTETSADSKVYVVNNDGTNFRDLD